MSTPPLNGVFWWCWPNWVTPEVVGRFGLALAVTTPVFALLNLNLRALLATDVNNAYNFETYLGLRMATIAVPLAVICDVILGTGYGTDLAIEGLCHICASYKRGMALSSDYYITAYSG